MKPNFFVPLLLPLALFFCVSDPSFSANSARPTVIRQPVPRATIRSAKPSSQKGSAKSSSQKSKKGSKPLPNLKIIYPSDEGSADSPTLASPPIAPLMDPDEVLDEDRVIALFPQTTPAEIKENPSFRLLVTIHGTDFSEQSKAKFDLKKGSALVCPDHKIEVNTPACELILQEGCVVTIDVTKTTTYVRDYHDRWKGHVIVKTEHGEDIKLMPGVELIVTEEIDPKLAWTHAVRHKIRRRGLAQVVSDPKHIIYKGEFSIPDAMLKSNHFHLLQKTADSNVKYVIDEVTKTAALLHMSDTRGPFSLMQ